MKDYEQIGENCKILWREGFEVTSEKYTQVSGYIFNDNNELLTVKSEAWTIPGGHPEPNETKEETLVREVMEEACITIKDIKYLGAVEVVENGETYYQLRYTAKVDEVLPFNQEWEVSERAFVSLDKLQDYIKWSKGIAFSSQIESAKKVWDIK
jgi:8-oxo-dGTP pyrophosphatase MutT (NUDIX family)